MSDILFTLTTNQLREALTFRQEFDTTSSQLLVATIRNKEDQQIALRCWIQHLNITFSNSILLTRTDYTKAVGGLLQLPIHTELGHEYYPWLDLSDDSLSIMSTYSFTDNLRSRLRQVTGLYNISIELLA